MNEVAMDKSKLGEALLKANKISQDNLKSASMVHDKIGGDFAAALVKLGYVKESDVTQVIAQAEGISTIDVRDLVIPRKLVHLISREIVEKSLIIPISRQDDVLQVAMANVGDFEAIEEIQFRTGCRVERFLASRDAIKEAITLFFSEAKEEEKKLEKIQKTLDEISNAVRSGKLDLLKLNQILLSLLMENKLISPHDLQDKLDLG
jgi:type IV pilus assembly protein PilB